MYSGSSYLIVSPYSFIAGSIYNFILNADGYPSYFVVNYTNGVRPSISLKIGFTIADNDADDSVNNPYVVVTD